MCFDLVALDRYYNDPRIESLSPAEQHWRNPASFSRHASSVLDLITDLRGYFNGTHPRILDIGCNGGALTAELTALSPSVIGIDYSAPLIKSATERFPHITFVRAKAQNLPFEDGNFDLITCFALIDYLDIWQEVLASSVRVLKPGGVLALQFVRTLPVLQELIRSVCAMLAGRRRISTEIKRLRSKLTPLPQLGVPWMTRNGRSVQEVQSTCQGLGLNYIEGHFPKDFLIFHGEFVYLLFRKDDTLRVR